MNKELPLSSWLPISAKEVKSLGWEELDVIIVSGDAYVDHPSFGHAVIARTIENLNLKVAIIPQPNWQDDLRDFRKLGKPKYFFAVTSGNMDSMMNHYTANKRLRSNDAYTPGGASGFRPDRAITIYSNILKDLYPDTPIIIGGIEASLRRISHYDYWEDQLHPSLLVDSKADMMVYGMGEKPIIEIVNLLKKGVPFSSLTTIPQTSFLQPLEADLPKNKKWQELKLVSHEEVLPDTSEGKRKFANNFRLVEIESNRQSSNRITQKIGDQRVIINPPFPTISEKEIDSYYDLPYTRLPHPRYNKRGKIPAYEMIKHSITLHRGCFGGCSFCTISAHQGNRIISRSKKSILKELQKIIELPEFKGYISDLGGPSANMYKMAGKDQDQCDKCPRPSCIFPKICKNLDTDHSKLLELYNEVSNHPKIKQAAISSGVRYDLFLDNTHPSHKEYAEQLISKHVSGRLKVAPEHTDPAVLKLMRKPSFKLFEKFEKSFHHYGLKHKLKYQLIPYFISGHPACTLEKMEELQNIMKDTPFTLEQVQDFTPTPMTLATVIFYSGINPYSGEEVFVEKTKDGKLQQRSLFSKK